MECPKCHNDFLLGIKAAYWLGVMNGQDSLTAEGKSITIKSSAKDVKSLKQYQAVTHILFQELRRLDKEHPLPDCCIRISRGDAERLVAYLNKHKAVVIAKRIQNALDTQIITEITVE